jgi:FAD/FMN-containing dehydrogenase
MRSLPENFRGRVVLADDAAFAKATTVIYGGFDTTPAAVAYARDVDDVVVAVRHAREHGLEIAVRGGGHSPARHSLTDGGLVLDVSGLDSMSVNLDERTATAGAGLRAGAYTATAAKHGLATGFGDTGTVSIGGITLVGGAGFLSRAFGLTIDNLLRAQVVTADGDVVEATEREHPDLFWGLRGGGGNFGVVTELTFRLQPVAQVTGGMLVLPATADTIRGFAAAAEAAPRSLSAVATAMVAPPMPFLPPELHGTAVLLSFMCDSGDPSAAPTVYEPFRDLGEVLADMIAPIPYPQMFLPEGNADAPAPIVALSTAMVDSIDSVADAVVDSLAKPIGAMQAFQFRILGAAVRDVPHEATAYAHRDRLIMANSVVAVTDRDELPQAWARVKGLTEHLADDQGAYPGFSADAGEPAIERLYGAETRARLGRVKSAYDPTNLFHRNHNITPAA